MKNEIDDYIAGFPAAAKKQLKNMRAIIKEAAPDAQELISYGMPAYKLHGMLVYFAGYKAHIGFYPTPSGIKKFLQKMKYLNEKPLELAEHNCTRFDYCVRRNKQSLDTSF